MTDKPILTIYEERTFKVGDKTFIDSVAENNNAVCFEDNSETGYFYAVNIDDGQKIFDALHIYDVANVIDRHKPSFIKILWSEDLTKAFLSINNYYYAVFDFNTKAGYCRNGFPESKGSWTKVKERKLTDDLLEDLAK